MRQACVAAAGVVMMLAVAGSAQENAVSKAFEHYEAIRVALSSDQLKGVAAPAAALAPLAEQAAGAEAKKAAELLSTASDLKEARKHFGALSAALLPTFEKAALKDVHIFTCSMVEQLWAQRGKKIQNPYMGRAMASCGVPFKASKQLERPRAR